MKINIDVNEQLAALEVTIHTSSAEEENGKVGRLVRYMEQFEKQKDFFTFKTEDSIEILKQSDIFYIKISSREITIVTEHVAYKTKGRLYQLVESLDETIFIQVSKSAILNVTTLVRLENYFSGSMIALLSNGAKVPITRVYLPKIKKYFNV